MPVAVPDLVLVRPMKSWFTWTLFVLVIVAVADGFYAYHWYFARDGSSAKSGRQATLPEFKPDAFRFVHTEQQTIPPTVVNGRTVDTITYGVFQFRYSHSNPLEFWGTSRTRSSQPVSPITESARSLPGRICRSATALPARRPPSCNPV